MRVRVCGHVCTCSRVRVRVCSAGCEEKVRCGTAHLPVSKHPECLKLLLPLAQEFESERDLLRAPKADNQKVDGDATRSRVCVCVCACVRECLNARWCVNWHTAGNAGPLTQCAAMAAPNGMEPCSKTLPGSPLLEQHAGHEVPVPL